MGSAISLFEGATAVVVPRARFMPVKSCNDLLNIRSDRYRLSAEKRLSRNPDVQTDGIRIQLDPKYFKRIEDFDLRFHQGAPSLLACESLTVVGDVHFGKNITIIGSVTITNPSLAPAVIPDGAVIKQDLTL
jgi:UTP--glucose-1-phosphate uridylyltransferase